MKKKPFPFAQQTGLSPSKDCVTKSHIALRNMGNNTDSPQSEERVSNAIQNKMPVQSGISPVKRENVSTIGNVFVRNLKNSGYKGQFKNDDTTPQRRVVSKSSSNFNLKGSDMREGEVNLCNVVVPYLLEDGQLWLGCKSAFSAAGMKKHIEKEGYVSIDKRLKKRVMQLEKTLSSHNSKENGIILNTLH